MVPTDLHQSYIALLKAMQNLNIAKASNPSTIPLYEQQMQKAQIAYNQCLSRYNMPPGTDIGPMLQNQTQQQMMNNMANMNNMYTMGNMNNMGNMANIANMNNLGMMNMNTQQTQQMSNNMANSSMVGSRYSDTSNVNNNSNLGNLLNPTYDNIVNNNNNVNSNVTTKSNNKNNNSSLLDKLTKTSNFDISITTEDIFILDNVNEHKQLTKLLSELLEHNSDYIGIMKKLYSVDEDVYNKLDMFINKRLVSILKYCYGLEISLDSFTKDYHELLAYVESTKESYYDLSVEIKNIIPELLNTLNYNVVEDDNKVKIIITAETILINCDNVEDEVKDEFIEWYNNFSYSTWDVDNVLAKSVIISKLDKIFNNTGYRSKTYHKPFNKSIKLKLLIGNDVLNSDIYISSKLDYITNFTITKELFKIY